VLIIDVPEVKVLQHPDQVGDLEEHDRPFAIAHGAAYCAHKLRGIGNVLERHLAAEEIGLDVRILLGVEVLDELDVGVLAGRVALFHKGRIKADTFVVAHLAQDGEKLALAAADLDHLLVPQIVFLNQGSGQLGVEGAEGRRKTLRLFILGRVFVNRGIEHGVGHKAALRAEAERDVALRIAGGHFARGHQQHAVHRNLLHFVKHAHGADETVRTSFSRVHENTPLLIVAALYCID